MPTAPSHMSARIWAGKLSAAAKPRRQKSTPRASAKSGLTLHGFRLSVGLQGRLNSRRAAHRTPMHVLPSEPEHKQADHRAKNRYGQVLCLSGKVPACRSAILDHLADALGNFPAPLAP